MDIDDYEHEHGVGNCWIAMELRMRVKNRIACEELGYPESEALYSSVAEWESVNKKCWVEWWV